MILLDTHVVVWLYQDAEHVVPKPVRDRVDAEQVGLSPYVTLELQYLFEIGRLSVPAKDIVDQLGPALEMVVADPSSREVCEKALGVTWTRDGLDRLLSAHALLTGADLVTKDRTIRANLPCAWWSEDPVTP